MPRDTSEVARETLAASTFQILETKSPGLMGFASPAPEHTAGRSDEMVEFIAEALETCSLHQPCLETRESAWPLGRSQNRWSGADREM